MDLVKRRFFWFWYVCVLVVLLETFSRAFLMFSVQVPFWKPSQIVLKYYPELRNVQDVNKERGKYFDILFLGASTLRQGIEPQLRNQLQNRTTRKVRIFNLAKNAHSSLDDYYKYKFLQKRGFDLVLLYDGFNEVRANNCSAAMFKTDYSHYSWYEQINIIEAHPEINVVSFPYVIHDLFVKVVRKITRAQYVPTNWPNKEWTRYGCDIKTKGPFRDHLNKILALAERKGEKFLMMTFAYYIPDGYSQEKFDKKALDYGSHHLAIEVWGAPACVEKGILAHNEIVKEFIGRSQVLFVDQAALIPAKGIYFNDVCHFTAEGTKIFVDNISGVIENLLRGGKDMGAH